MAEEFSILPVAVIEHKQAENGGILVAVSPAAEDERGIYPLYDDAPFPDLDKRTMQEMLVNTLASGLATAVLAHEELTGEQGKTMTKAIEQLNAMYVSPSSKVTSHAQQGTQDSGRTIEAPEGGPLTP